MKICIFEDEGYKNLYPLTLFRPTFELKCGYNLLWEKIRRKFPDQEVSFFIRDYLIPTLKKRIPRASFNDFDSLKKDDLLLINGRWLMDKEVKLSVEGEEEVATCKEAIVYARLKKETLKNYLTGDFQAFLEKVASQLKKKETLANLITYPWDLVNNNGEAIADDFQALGKNGVEGEISSQAAIVGDKSKLYVAKGAQVHPFAVLDTTGGPVIIDEGAIVYPHSRIEGPSCVGKNSKIVGGKIREGSSIGPVTNVGGEVEEIIFQGYANKFHDGFIGHSYICEWVNLGALVTNSDLKNNYGLIKVYVNGRLMNSGEIKLGSFIGDHTKIGIGTLLNTGTIVGACANIFSGGMPPKFVPSFSWGSGSEFVEFELDKAIKTAEIVLGRRKVKQAPEDVALIKQVYQLTAEEREKWGISKKFMRP